MDWVDRPQNYKGHLIVWNFATFARLPFDADFPLKTLKLGWVAFHSLKFQLQCLDFSI